MNIDQLLEMLGGELPDFNKLKEALKKESYNPDVETYLKQYNVDDHEVMDKTKRRDKAVIKDGQETTEPVTRIALSYQEMIAQRQAAFLCANGIDYDSAPNGNIEQAMYDGLVRIREKTKLDYKTLEIAEKKFSETEVAELWFLEEIKGEDDFWSGTEINAKFKPRVLILSRSNGDDLYPVFDQYGDMIAFGRGYTIPDGEDKVEHFDIYMADKFYLGVKGKSGWDVKTEDNIVGKIMVVYHSQKRPVWYNVQTQIDRKEKKMSNHADTNDYNDSPLLFTKGEIKGIASKGDSGKILEGEGESDAKYITWDGMPNSLKLEFDNLDKAIHTLTDTPDISFDNLKGIGDVSGVTMKFMFMGAHLRAAINAGPFGESIQRRINLHKAIIATIDKTKKSAVNMQIKPVFEFFMPKDVEGEVSVLTTALTGGIISQETAVKKNPLVENPDQELELIKKESATRATSPAALDATMNE